MNAHRRRDAARFSVQSELFAAKRIPPSSTRKEHHASRDDTANSSCPRAHRGSSYLGYSGSWGYGPSGILGVILIIVLVLVLLGKV